MAERSLLRLLISYAVLLVLSNYCVLVFLDNNRLINDVAERNRNNKVIIVYSIKRHVQIHNPMNLYLSFNISYLHSSIPWGLNLMPPVEVRRAWNASPAIAALTSSSVTNSALPVFSIVRTDLFLTGSFLIVAVRTGRLPGVEGRILEREKGNRNILINVYIIYCIV